MKEMNISEWREAMLKETSMDKLRKEVIDMSEYVEELEKEVHEWREKAVTIASLIEENQLKAWTPPRGTPPRGN